MSILIFILIIGLLVLIHELGHFITAKRSGILVEEFGFGFPPRLFGIKIGETLYSLNLIPLGGFVKLFGEEYYEIADKKASILKKRAFVYKPVYQRAKVIVAGVLMNILLGVSIYYLLLATNGFQSELLPLFKSYHFRFGTQEGKVVVANVIKNSPAQKAQIQTEDIILRLNISKEMNNNLWSEVKSTDFLINNIKKSEGKNIFLDIQNIKNGQKKIVEVIPNYDYKLKRTVIGVNLVDAVIIKYDSPLQKMFSGFFHAYNICAYNINIFSYLFQISFKEKNIAPVAETVSGPIGIFQIINEVVKSSGGKAVVNLLNITALMSLSLGLLNIFPFPALDGGRLLFVFYEGITKKRVNKTVEQYINLAGFIFLIILALLISVNDIMKIFAK